MSQAAGMATGSRAGTSKAVPVLLLALAVALGAAILHAMDDSPTATEATLQATQSAQETAAAPVTEVPVTVVAARPPSEIKVLITNGTQISGAAAKLNSLLVPAGYQLGTPNNTIQPTPESSVQYQTGFEAEAKGVATALGLPESLVRQMPTPAPVADTQGANVLVIMGEELATTTNANVEAPATTVAPTSNALNGPLGNLTPTTAAGQTSAQATQSQSRTQTQGQTATTQASATAR